MNLFKPKSKPESNKDLKPTESSKKDIKGENNSNNSSNKPNAKPEVLTNSTPTTKKEPVASPTPLNQGRGRDRKRSILDFFRKKKVVDGWEIDLNAPISGPTAFRHNHHVDFDEETGITGMPSEWTQGSQSSSTLTKEQLRVQELQQQQDATMTHNIDVTGYCDLEKEKPLYLVDFISTKEPRREFGPLSRIGSGSTGLVYRAIRIKDKKKCAIKIIELKADTKLDLFENEIRMMRVVCQQFHPNICQFYGCYSTETELWICMEYLPGGCLTDLLRINLPEDQIAALLKETLKALVFLHDLHVIHRDIKSDNLLITREGEIKLVDFGFTCLLSKQRPLRKSVVGTPYWMAPEVTKGQSYDVSCDIWSLGVMSLELAEGVVPRLDLEPIRALFVIAHEPPPSFKQPEKWSEEFKSFVDNCLQKEANKRPTAKQLLEHPFMLKAANLDSFLPELVKTAKKAKKNNKTLSQIMREQLADEEPSDLCGLDADTMI